MTQLIARIYDTETSGKAAMAALQEAGFRIDDIHMFAGATASDDGASSTDSTLAAIVAAGIAPAHAAVYAAHVAKGEILVAVKPPFGGARLAGEIMDGLSPVAVTLPAAPVEMPSVGMIFSSTSATPLSDAFGWKVLLNDPTPLSTYMGWSVLKQETGPSSTLAAIRRQSANPTPFSKLLGLPVLSDNAAPLSTKLGWKLLWDKAAPLSEKFGWKLLLDKSAPLSDALGWKLLLNNPTPLSSMLGWPVLSK